MSKYFFTLGCLLYAVFGFAQQDSLIHYFSIQANPLMRQVLNFGGGTPGVNNPFLIKYANENRKGAGLNIGIGLNLDKDHSGDEFNELETAVQDISFRIGFDKNRRLGSRFLWTLGWDAVFEFNGNKTTNTFNNGGDDNEIITKTSTTSFGLGPRLNFAYAITNQILVGTEASYYLLFSKEKLSVEDDINPGDDFEEDFNSSSFGLVLPAVIYLTFRFY